MPGNPEVYTPLLSARSATPLVNSSAIANSTDRQDVVNETALASRASNAANAAVPLTVAPQPLVVLSAQLMPLSSQAGSATNFANVAIIDAGTDGTGTAVIASYTFSATGTSIAANGLGALTVVAPSVASGHQIALSYSSQGNGIPLVAHSLSIAYRLQ